MSGTGWPLVLGLALGAGRLVLGELGAGMNLFLLEEKKSFLI